MKTRFIIGYIYFILLFLPWISGAESLKDLERSEDRSQRIKQLKIKNLSDLQKLTPYETISVLQRRFLPKTFRVEFNFSPISVINNYYFYSIGAYGHIGFFIREHHGVGIEGFIGQNIKRPVTFKYLQKQIFPSNNAYSKGYGGVYYKWSPIFGKFAILNKKIVYFDTYFHLGVGMHFMEGLSEEDQMALQKTVVTQLELAKDLHFAGNLGIGQVFAITKNLAVNWEVKYVVTLVEFVNKKELVGNVDLLLGLNYYVPGVDYR